MLLNDFASILKRDAAKVGIELAVVFKHQENHITLGKDWIMILRAIKDGIALEDLEIKIEVSFGTEMMLKYDDYHAEIIKKLSEKLKGLKLLN